MSDDMELSNCSLYQLEGNYGIFCVINVSQERRLSRLSLYVSLKDTNEHATHIANARYPLPRIPTLHINHL